MESKNPPQEKKARPGALWLAASKHDPEMAQAILEIQGARHDFEERGPNGKKMLEMLLEGSIWERGIRAGKSGLVERERGAKESRALEECAAECVRLGADPFSRSGTSWDRGKSAIAVAFEKGRSHFLGKVAASFGAERTLSALLEEIPQAPSLAVLDEERGGEKIALLIAWGLDPKSPEAGDWLANCESEMACQALLAAGVDPKALCSDGKTALEWIAKNPRGQGSKIMALLAAAQSKDKDAQGRQDPAAIEAALSAIGEGRLGDARKIAKSGGFDLARAVGAGGESALERALGGGWGKIALKLLEEGAEPLRANPDGIPAFARIFSAPYAETPGKKRERDAVLEKIRSAGWLAWRGPRGESLLEALLASRMGGEKTEKVSLSSFEELSRDACRPDGALPRGLLGLIADQGGGVYDMSAALRGDPSRDRMALDQAGDFALAKALAKGLALAEPQSRWSGYEPALEAWDFERALGKPESAQAAWAEARCARGAGFALGLLGEVQERLALAERCSVKAEGQARLALKALEQRGLLGKQAWDPIREGAAEAPPGRGSLAEALASAAISLATKSRSPMRREELRRHFESFAEFARPGGDAAAASYWSHLLEICGRDRLYALNKEDLRDRALEEIQKASLPRGCGPLGFGEERAREFERSFPEVALELEKAALRAAAPEALGAPRPPRAL